MHLTRNTDYALRMLIPVVIRDGQMVTITEVADAYRISRNHQVKVVNTLGHQGYLQTIRGKGPKAMIFAESVVAHHGGAPLALSIASAANEPPVIAYCKLCSALGEAREAFMGVLDIEIPAALDSLQAATEA